MKRDADYESLAADDFPAAREGAADGFRVVAITLVVAVVWLVAWYWQTASEVGKIWWRSDTYAHGLTVLPLFAWLVWRARERIGALRPQPVPWLALPVVAAGVLWLLGRLVGVAAASHFALVAMLVAGLVGVLGWRLSRILLFPLAFLAFAVPIGDFLLPTLMNFTAEFTVRALRMSGVPVYHEGLHFIVPNGRWSVVEACSGIRYLIASTMIGALYAYLSYATLRKRVLFMLVALLVPIVANWLRAYMIVMLGYLSDNRLAAGVDHLIYGWIFFGVVILLMFWIGGRWREEVPAAPATPAQAASRTKWAAALPIALAVAAFPLAHRVIDGPVAEYSVKVELPGPTPGWSEASADRLAYRPHYANARGEAFAMYRAPDGEPVGVYAAWYADQRDGSEMVAWGNGLVGTTASGTYVVSRYTADARGTRVPGADLNTPQGRMRVWHWYRVNGRLVTGDAEVKLRLALDRVLGRPDESSVVVLVTPEHEAPQRAEKRLREFVEAHGERIDAALDAVARERMR